MAVGKLQSAVRLERYTSVRSKRKDYNPLIIMNWYDVTMEEAREIIKRAKGGDKSARKFINSCRKIC